MFKSRADLLIAAGESIKMQEKFGINPMMKVNGTLHPINYCIFNNTYSDDEFPLAVVEGKPVFVGDELYDLYGNKGKANHVEDSCHGILSIWTKNGCLAHIEQCSWNPPKPKTVMVELLREDAEILSSINKPWGNSLSSVTEACRKALKETK